MKEKHLVYCRIERDGAVLLIRRAAGVFLAGAVGAARRWRRGGGAARAGRGAGGVGETGLRIEVLGERSAHAWMDVAGRPPRIHARVFDVRENGSGAVVLNPAEHDDHAWVTPEQAARLELAEHFRDAVAG